MSWLQFAAVMGAFFLTHSIPVRPQVRSRLVGVMGARGFTFAYSILSLGMLTAVIVAAGHAPFVLLWPQAPWQHHLVLVGMFVACMILAFSLAAPNPFSFGGAQNDRFDPARPGIVRWIRHPVLAVLALWAGLHMLPNGDLAHIIVFGLFAGFAVLGRSLINRRKKREMTQARWLALRAETASGLTGLTPIPVGWLVTRAIAGLCIYLGMLLFHSLVIGVSVALF